MNNTFNANSLPQPQQHHHQNAPTTTTTQSIAYIPAHAHLPAHLNTLTEEQGSAFFAARSLEKTFGNYAGAPTNRFYGSAANATTATGLPNLTGAHNTILITNNFSQQNMPTILSATTTTSATNNSNNNNNHLDAGTLRLSAGQFYPQQQQQQFSTHLNNLHNHWQTLAVQQQQQQQQQHYFTEQLANVDSKLKGSTNAGNNSTVVLDRINICINNHYNEALTSNNIETPLTCSTTTTAGVQLEQQPSPVIPAIQHKATILTDNVAIHVIDEPDSTTTTAHTPPITPNNETIVLLNSPLHQSPSTTTAICTTDTLKDVELADFKEMTPTTTIVIDCDENEAEEQEKLTNNNIAEIEPSNNTTVAMVPFKIGEDVLLKRQDNRFYLGTVIGNAHEQYLVRFDDQSEQWCLAAEMRKLGGGGGGGCGGSPEKNIANNVDEETPMCVACKLVRPTDVVECCERCGRGYHRGCTTEIYAGSNEWLCKRCAKSMKVHKNHEHEEQIMSTFCRQLPYHVDTLNWDEKHRVNEEQIYCYCGKTGKFDNNMLQCIKCKNWFHTHCIQNFKHKLLRGDCFFVFCCSVCQNGEEFLRRLQIDWVDVLHLTLYNLSALKKHQHHRYHHLVKDIWPYVLEKRQIMPMPKEWRKLPDATFMELAKNTLKEHTNRFVCGREGKRDQYYYALRHNGPPIPPNLHIDAYEELTDDLLIKKFKLKLLPDAPENLGKSHSNADIYEFRIEDDEKFTSDDELPIKMILDKVKRNKSTESVTLAKPDLNDSGLVKSPESKLDTSNDKVEVPNDDEMKETIPLRSSRKRKAFTHLKSYKETAEENGKRFYSVDSSSDENSSSSRATSLDIIIPPPKNFLGPNNPFRMVTPKKHNVTSTYGAGGARTVKNSILNTSSLNFSSNLAAFKSVGIFANLTKAGGQPRTVRTIKRRLSAKDIMIGPNQEVRRRRTRRTSANVEVISTTTINPIHSNLFPLHAKELFSHNVAQKAQISLNSSSPNTISSCSRDSSDIRTVSEYQKPTHGRLLRQRPQKQSPNNSRRSSMSSSSSHQSFCAAENRNNNNNNSNNTTSKLAPKQAASEDLKQSVNKYFGAVNRIQSGEQFCIRAKRRLANGQSQYLIEWGSD